ncbi:MAG TPA: diaminopimelate epimerase [Planctomycetota bacterium]|nr:diaminopimelate epimerase [Planctomycetota bacterium]
MALRFSKMHGCGNDYVYVDGFRENVPDPPALARRVSDRHFGVGSDGLIVVLPSAKGDVRMRMYNADGSESEMCGNGVRCVAKLAYEAGHARKPEVAVEVGREGATRVLPIRLTVAGDRVTAARVDMGRPGLAPDLETIEGATGLRVSMGNPHFVIFGEPSDANVLGLGPKLEKASAFPDRSNIEFAQAEGPAAIRLRVWERGSGETLACGTGACATLVAAVRLGKIPGRRATLRLLGGDLDIEWPDPQGSVFMTGPCVEVFRGELVA